MPPDLPCALILVEPRLSLPVQTALCQGLAEAGYAPRLLEPGADLVRALASHAPSLVVLQAPAGGAALAAWLPSVSPGPGAAVPVWPCLLLLMGTAEAMTGLLASASLGLPALEWLAWPGDAALPVAELLARLRLLRARGQQAQAQRERLADLSSRLDERKWVDRAKGRLMSARGLDEDQAFGLLRQAAMHSNLRLGEVSRSVVEASAWAEAINRAGQLRMLSQRLVKLAAQRWVEVEPRRARVLQTQSRNRVLAILDFLGALPAFAEAVNLLAANAVEPADLADTAPVAQGPVNRLHPSWLRVQRTWAELDAALSARLTEASLAEADARAEALLAAAEALTAELERSGARPALSLVNLCGRQRMRAQRVAKAALLGPAGQAQLGTTMDEFEAALLNLERAPLSSPEIRASLAAARDEWLRLLRGVRSADSPDGKTLLAGSSEALLVVLDELTAHYEHSLQVIMS